MIGTEGGSAGYNSSIKKILLEKKNVSDEEYQNKFSKYSKKIYVLNEKSLSTQEQQQLNDDLTDKVQKWHAVRAKNLIHEGANIDIKVGKNNNNLLIHAVENYTYKSSASTLAKDLLDAGIDINAQNDNGDTALIISAKRGLFSLVTRLIEAGANPDIENNDQKKAIDLICTEGGNSYQKNIKDILKSVTDRNDSNSEIDSEDEEFALSKSASSNHIDNNSDGDDEDFANNTSENDQVDNSMQDDAEDDISDEDFSDKSLIEEIQNWKTITSNSTNYNILVGDNQNTLLMHAVEHYSTTNFPKNRLAQLIKKGIDINAQNLNGDTALIIAAKTGNLTLIEHLISLKADPTIENNDGHAALSLIKEETNTASHKFTDYLQATSILRKKISAYNKKALSV
ncbi:MAG: ankyrin repeat domain-containing protein [Rickettsiaceae bacterium]|nr:ankyrin repeat domain-containing protein [Rickettsiaceae bacterium]